MRKEVMNMLYVPVGYELRGKEMKMARFNGHDGWMEKEIDREKLEEKRRK
jgi:hypothetical protein